MTSTSARRAGRAVTVTALLAASTVAAATVPQTAAAAPVTIHLCATTATVTMPTGANVAVWGYALGDCTGSPVAQLPGPVLDVDEGDTVTVVLHNSLPEATSLLFQGQALVPDRVGAPATGGTATYTFTAAEPGTYLYEAGLTANAQHQVALGMYGALIVRPSTPGQAYAAAATAYDDEAVLVLSEVDTALTPANAATFDMRKFKPRYFLINGKAYPDTASIATSAGERVLLRYVNAGNWQHSMSVLGGHQTVVALDGHPLTFSRRVVAETFGPGQTVDTIVPVSAAAAPGSRLMVYDASLLLANSNAAGFGGMMTFLTVGGTVSGDDTVGPTTSGVTLTPGTDVTINASISDAATGGSDVTAGEYFIDTVGATGSGTAMTGAFGSPTVAVTGTIPGAIVAALSTGNHSVYVRGQDSAGNWGAVRSALLHVDTTGPVTSGATLTPNPTNGSVAVAVHATGSDATTGGANVVAAEYTIDAGPAVAMTVNAPSVVASVDGVIPAPTVAALAAGDHNVAIRSQDAGGNWGAAITAVLRIDATGPATSGLTVNPPATNGTVGVSSSTPVVRVTATVVDAVSRPIAAEGFFDTVGSNGTGFPLSASDGTWNSLSENVRVDIPLSTINALTSGNHTIWVHGKDAVGNWGATASAGLILDRTPPTVSGIVLTPSPTQGALTVALTATGTDSQTAISRAEWFIGADPGVGNATAMAVTGTGPYSLAATIDTSGRAPGNYVVSVRARDAAGNWSVLGTGTLTVSPLTFSTFGNTNPPGVGGTADDADLYSWNGTAFARVFDASTAGIPGAANVDGLDRTDATHFYLSFAADTTITGLGAVQDEDIVFYNAGTWSVYFDGTAAGLTAANLDIDEFDISGGVLRFSTLGNTNPPGVGGTADDADVYSWNGTSFARVWDATANGVPAAANVDGLAMQDATHFRLSFAADTTITGLGAVQDKDVVLFNAGAWSNWFDGTAAGLTNANHDPDAIDVS